MFKKSRRYFSGDAALSLINPPFSLPRGGLYGLSTLMYPALPIFILIFCCDRFSDRYFAGMISHTPVEPGTHRGYTRLDKVRTIGYGLDIKSRKEVEYFLASMQAVVW